MHSYINRKELDTEKLACTHFIDYKTGTEYTNLINEGQIVDLRILEAAPPGRERLYGPRGVQVQPGQTGKGQAARRHVDIDDDSIRYIGKETNDLGESETIGVNEDNYTEYIKEGKIEWKEILDSLTPDKVVMAGISPRNLRYLKRRVRQGLPLNMKTSTKNNILELYRGNRKLSP